ncbi:hypothetical protein [Parvularcula oceani]|uniref:hypothetical protein n=1 Tax=Parvularcula oceani TaxID=1247963 RepID=UPI0004E1FF42|nr:hypothetical protein [Parvularcula oceani]
MKTIEQYERMRRSLMTAYAATFFVWAGALTGLFVFVIEDRAVPDPVALLLLIGTVGGFLGWAASGLCLFLLGRRIGADPKARTALNDERSRQNTERAFIAGFWVLTGLAAAAIALEVGFGVVLTGKTLGLAMIWLGVTVVLSLFVVLESRDAA